MLKEKKLKQPNDLLRHEREKRGWSQAKLAEVIDVDPSMISRWERGERKPEYVYQEKLCELFKKNAIELGFIEPLPIPESPNTNAILHTSFMQTDLKTNDDFIRRNSKPVVHALEQEEGSIHSPGGGLLEAGPERPATHDTEGDNMKKMTRRNLLGAGVEVGVAALVVPSLLNSDEAERLLSMFEDENSIDIGAVSSFEKITDSHWQLVYGGVPKHGLIHSVLGHSQSIGHFLQTSQPTAIKRRLSALASQQAQMMVEIYFDMHDYAKAEYYAKASVETARQAANPALYAVALARMSFLYTYSHQFQEALSLLQVARCVVSQSPVSTIRCWLAAMEAEVHARLYASQPDTIALNKCLKALEGAEHIIEQLGEDPYWTKFSPASFAGYKGVCFRHLRKPEDAQTVLLEALASIHKEVPGGQATAFVDLGSVYAQQGKVEEACYSATQALDIISRQNKSVNILQRVYDFRLELEPWASTSYVQNLDERITVVRLRVAPPSFSRK